MGEFFSLFPPTIDNIFNFPMNMSEEEIIMDWDQFLTNNSEPFFTNDTDQAFLQSLMETENQCKQTFHLQDEFIPPLTRPHYIQPTLLLIDGTFTSQ